MYQRRSNLQNLMILLLDCLTIVVSLILANYIRNGRLFESDDARMDFGLLLGAVLVVFLAMNLFGSLYRNMMLRGPLHECMCVIRNNAISFAGAAVVLYFMGLLDAYSRLVFFYFLLIDCILMLIVHQLWKKCLPSLYRIFRESRKTLLVADDVFAVPLVMDMKNFKDYSYEFCGLAFLGEKPENGEVGGVDVVIPESANGLEKGWTTGAEVHLKGDAAYRFIRYRDTAQEQSAEARLERQKQYLKKFILQAKEAMKQDMTLPLQLYTQITPYMVTDVTADEAVYLAGQALSYSFGDDDFYSMTGTVKMGEKFEEFYPDETALYELVLDVFYEEAAD